MNIFNLLKIIFTLKPGNTWNLTFQAKKNLEKPGILNKNLEKTLKNLEFITIFTC